MEIDATDCSTGKVRDLFGGAFTCCIPKNAQDVSVIRDVPDNQEVFCHESTDQSVMVDILEYQTGVIGEKAIRYHFDDLASSNDAIGEHEVSYVEALSHEVISLKQCQEAWFLSGRQMISKFNEKNCAKNLIHIHMVLYRLPQYETDIIVIMNVPVAISKGSSSSASSSPNDPDAWNVEVFKKLACSLQLIDPNIFGEA